jgi:protein SCO1/2
MRALALIVLFAVAHSAPADAALSKAVLESITAMPQPKAAIPLSLSFRDENGAPITFGAALAGKPALLVFADYTCRTLCGPIVEFAAGGLEKTGLRPGEDFRLLIVGIDPRDSLAEGRALKARHADPGSPLSAATLVLTGDDAAVRAATAAADYRFAYDADHDQFAHPAAAFVLDAQGRISRVLSALGLDDADLRLALVDASAGRIGTIGDQVRLLCYGFDPAKGIYTASITLWLAGACIMTVVLLICGIALLASRTPREVTR